MQHVMVALMRLYRVIAGQIIGLAEKTAGLRGHRHGDHGLRHPAERPDDPSYHESALSGLPGLAASGLEQSGLEALTSPLRTLAVATAVERTFMLWGAGNPLHGR